jgi:hypothetical protein
MLDASMREAFFPVRTPVEANCPTDIMILEFLRRATRHDDSDDNIARALGRCS